MLYLVLQLETGYMKHVTEVFERLGFIIGNETSDWTVLWSHDFPFGVLAQHMNSLKSHQRVMITLAKN
jgi:tubulin monoglycylase TTLL15